VLANELQRRLQSLADPQRAQAAARFFKTRPDESSTNLCFLGLDAATLRTLAKDFRALPLGALAGVLRSRWHDERGVALLILVLQYPRADAAGQKRIYDFYLANTAHINSWALVDCSAPQAVGAHLFDKSRKPLDRLAKSKSLWERRIAIVATQYFIRQGDFTDTLRIAQRLLDDEEDLIHKAVGWMLREVGKRDDPALESFLKKHYPAMPRTMLRYAIERFPEAKRKRYLAGIA
jgi:3-methyladenine DNA glycosylase AlkD